MHSDGTTADWAYASASAAQDAANRNAARLDEAERKIEILLEAVNELHQMIEGPLK